MARVRIVNENVTFDMPDGARLMDYAKSASGMQFGCGDGDCGMCVCSVAKGSENINRKTQKEEVTLARIKAYPSQRLACQITVKKGEIEIEY